MGTIENQNKIVKHVSVRLTWHDNGWNGESCKNPEKNESCQQNFYISSIIHIDKNNNEYKCSTYVLKVKNYINNYLKKNSCFLQNSDLGCFCEKHSTHLVSENKIVDIPPCDSFSAFKNENPYIHTKNPIRKMDKFDVIASKECNIQKKYNKYINYFPQDYRKYIIDGSSIALFYTVNSPLGPEKFVIGYSLIKEKNDKFISCSIIKNENNKKSYVNMNGSVSNKSNVGNRWGEEWCFMLDEVDRYRFPFQELIVSGNEELLGQVKNILIVESKDEKYFRNLSLFIPEHILIKYLKKLRQAISLLEFYGFSTNIGNDISKIDEKIQKLDETYLSFKYPGLPAVGRFLNWETAFEDYAENLNYEDKLKEEFFNAIQQKEDSFYIIGINLDDKNGASLNTKPASNKQIDLIIKLVSEKKISLPKISKAVLDKEIKSKEQLLQLTQPEASKLIKYLKLIQPFFIGSKKKNMHPKQDFPENFINLLKDIIIYYPISSEEVIKRIKLLINKNIIDIEKIKENPYILYEKFIPSLDGSVDLGFEDIDYGEYKRMNINNSKEAIKKSFYLNPYRIRALIHEYFKVYRDDPGFIWISFKDIESYVRRRLSSSLGLGIFDFNFEEILENNKEKFIETIEIDWEKKYLTLKKLAKMEEEVKNKIENLLNKNIQIQIVNIKTSIKEVLSNPNENEIQEKEEVIQKLLQNKFTFVSGVAGAGKSTVIKIFIDVLNGENYKILTPTGKASERLRGEDLESETIHYFLKSNSFIDNDLFIFKEDGNVQEIENLIIDEISMVPLDLLYYLFKAINLDKVKRIIFVGDIKQLPPIGYGYPAKDIYNYLDQNSKENLVKLEKSYRSNDEFIKLANKLRTENLTKEDITTNITQNNFQILQFSNQETLEKLINYIIAKEKITKKNLAQNPESFQILTPKKEGYTGSNHINRYISSLFNKDKFSWGNTKVIKLINTYCPSDKTDCVETFNGMIGSVFYKDGWKIRFKGGQIIPFSLEKMGYEYDYAYAITIHKSQGSEFDTVVVILPKDIGNLFTRELLYTALTRAKKKLYLLIEDENLLYETPFEIERSSKMFEENLLELPDSSGYTSLKGKNILSKLDLYISTLLELNNISYEYKTSGADFSIQDKKINIHLINLNTYQGKVKDKAIRENEQNIKLVYEKDIDIKSFAQELGIRNYRDRSNENKKDYREEIRNQIMEEYKIHIEPDTNFKIITHNGLITRSISEAILMLMFDHLNLNYKYEEKVEFNGKSILPDFYFPERKIYWEHLGLLDDPYYLEKWKNKKEIYKNARIDGKTTINVLSFEKWNGEPNCCIYTTEEDIRNLSNLWNKLNKKFGSNGGN